MQLIDILVLLISFLSSLFAISKTIFIAKKKNLFDEPSEQRKVHTTKTPNLAGVAIYSSFAFTVTLFYSFYGPIEYSHILIAASIIIFFTGLTDDLSAISPYNKLAGQLVAALILCFFTDLRLTSLYGIFGIEQLPYYASIVITTIVIIFIINAYNLVDGINWLAGSLGLLAVLCYSYIFFTVGLTGFFLMSIVLCATLVSFLFFNKTPAKIFLGDSGSLFIGFCVAICSLKFLSFASVSDQWSNTFINAPAIVCAILITPIMDTLRVFIIRVLNKKSPFAADKNHLHHLLLNAGYSHMQSTGVIILSAVPAILLTLFFHAPLGFAIMLSLISTTLMYLLIYISTRRQATTISSSQLQTEPAGKLVVVEFKKLAASVFQEESTEQKSTAGTKRHDIFPGQPSSTN
ncbi:MAG: undecaprenyl/decaprenyl-phosphate alpha-N-acetylglucosaminyl 1-phosphate transferase [Chitinophagaceae bacterium]|nr:undecaprenyl/decaprenyl-phosphate alpha-N-acetylglucosaminyl 1-phosphate transferase [Chitinophagaceae bacterium]